MKIVSVLAHQDDECRCLGTLLKSRARGDELGFITLTDGSNGMVQSPWMTRKKAAAIRHREMSRLAAALDADYVNLRIEDEFLFDTAANRRALIEALRRTRPDVVFTHYPVDYNADHIVTHDLVRHCAMLASLPVVPTRSRPLARHPAVFLVPPTGAVPFPATHFVDVTEHMDRKIELLLFHASQEEALRQALGRGFDRHLRTMDASFGLQAGCDYAEAFVPMQARGAVRPGSILP
jgi:LmbE family N-acetylglucosaminyl deacetylase